METVNIHLPRQWRNCSRRQYRWLLKTMIRRSDLTTLELKAIAMVRLTGMKILWHNPERTEFLVKYARKIFEIDAEEFALIVRRLDWVLFPPDYPWRPDSIAWGKPKDPLLMDVDFQTYLELENLYQGYLATEREDILRMMARKLVRRRLRRFRRWELLAVFFWYASVKDWLASRFPHFFESVSPERSLDGTFHAPTQKQLQEAMDAQIRALTKGDIAREEMILDMPCHRALTELDAQAREYQELKSETK